MVFETDLRECNTLGDLRVLINSAIENGCAESTELRFSILKGVRTVKRIYTLKAEAYVPKSLGEPRRDGTELVVITLI